MFRPGYMIYGLVHLAAGITTAACSGFVGASDINDDNLTPRKKKIVKGVLVTSLFVAGVTTTMFGLAGVVVAFDNELPIDNTSGNI